MEPGTGHKPPAGVILAYACGFLAVQASFSFVWTVSHRLFFPYEIEWLEGIGMDHVIRTLQGLPFYAKPSTEFISFIYTPLYFLFSALPFLFGLAPGFWFGRLVSILSTVGTAIVIYRMIRRNSGNRFAALVFAALVPASYGICAFWFDLMKSDSLMMFLVFLATSLLDDPKDRVWRSASSAFLYGLAFFVKQTAAPFILAAGLFVLIFRRRAILPFVAAGVTTVIGGLVLCQFVFFGKWFWYYIYVIPDKEPFLQGAALILLLEGLLGLVLPLLVIISQGYRSKTRERPMPQANILSLFITVGGLAASFLGLAHWGGFGNNRYYFFAALFLASGLFAAPFLRDIPWRRESAEPQGSPANPKMKTITFVLGLLLCQFLLFNYKPSRCFPTESDRKMWSEIVEKVRRIPGDVWVPNHGFVSYLAGKPIHAHLYLVDYLHNVSGDRGSVLEELQKKIHRKKYSAILFDVQRTPIQLVMQDYELKRRLLVPDSTFSQYMSGLSAVPSALYLPIQTVQGSPGENAVESSIISEK